MARRAGWKDTIFSISLNAVANKVNGGRDAEEKRAAELKAPPPGRQRRNARPFRLEVQLESELNLSRVVAVPERDYREVGAGRIRYRTAAHHRVEHVEGFQTSLEIHALGNEDPLV